MGLHGGTGSRVRLDWVIGDSLARNPTVYRRTAGGTWIELARPVASGGSIHYEDTRVLTGLHYAYRLGIPSAGHEVYRGQVEVDVSGDSDYRLERIWPNPAHGSLWVAFTLPTLAPTTIELFDVRGRRVLVPQAGALGPGVHRIELNQTSALGAGLYFLRVQQGSRSVTRRVCILGGMH